MQLDLIFRLSRSHSPSSRPHEWTASYEWTDTDSRYRTIHAYLQVVAIHMLFTRYNYKRNVRICCLSTYKFILKAEPWHVVCVFFISRVINVSLARQRFVLNILKSL